MCCVGGVQAATTAQSRTRIAARPYAMDNATRNRNVSPRGRLVQPVAVSALRLSRHLWHGCDWIASTASKGSLSDPESFQRVF